MGQDPAASGRRFHVHACLGRGGFGEVYRATMSSSGGVRTEVAVKILRADIDPGSEAVKRLRDEGRLLGALRHPAILRVHDLVLLEDRVALVTEYVEGQDLDKCVHADPPLPLRALVAVIGDVAAALDAAWSTLSPTTGQPIHLVHRDVKPANIRIGKHGEVKLLDFGIARATNVAREAQTANNAMMGSYLYMAPERFHEDTVDPPSDIYALGCVLFEGIAGTRLFEGMALKQIYGTMLSSRKYNAHVEQRFELLPDTTPPDVIALLRAMLNVDADERPAAIDVARRCEDLAEELPGPTLKRWARHRDWPGPELMPGTLDGRELTAHSFVSMGATEPVTHEDTWVGDRSEVEDLPLPRPIQATSLPPINLMALPSPGQTALDAPARPSTAPPPPTPEPPAPEPEPPAPEPEPEVAPPPEPEPEPEPDHDEDEPGLPEPGSYFAIEPNAEFEPIPGVLDEPPPPPANDDFEEQLRLMLQARRRRRMVIGILVMGLLAAVVFSGIGVVVMKPELLEAITASAASANDDSEGLAPRAPDPEPTPDPDPEPRADPKPEPKAKKPPPPPKPDPKPESKPDPKPAAPSASSLVAQGWSAVDRGDNAGALSLFDQALGLAPGSAEASYGRGYALLELGKTDDAVASLCQAIAKGDGKTRNEVESILTGKGLACP